MTLKIAADIHGAFDQLFDLLAPEDTLILLGDYLNVIDYDDLSGMIAEFVPKEVIKNVLDLISLQKLNEAKKLMADYSFEQEELFKTLTRMSHQQYEKLFAGLHCQVYLIWGNVDFPDVLKKHLKPNTHLVENSVIEIDKKRCGLVSGSPQMRYSFGMPGELTREEYRKQLYSLDPVDHLFVHAPPAIRDLTFDVLANRDEEGSIDLLSYIDAYKPKTVHFGHVHNPIKSFLRYNDAADLINVGHFRQTNKIVELD